MHTVRDESLRDEVAAVVVGHLDNTKVAHTPDHGVNLNK